MKNIGKTQILKIENATKTELVIEFLDATIGDEIILNSFVRSLRITSIKGNVVTVALPDEQALEIIKDKYLLQFQAAIKNVFEDNNTELLLTISGENDSDVSPVNTVTSKHLSSKLTLDNYIESGFNAKVIRIINTVIKNPGEFSPVFIHSASGLGKTHLLHGLGNKLDKMGYTSIYVESNKFVNDIVELSKTGKINPFIESFGKYDVLLFDDIQNLGSKTVTMKVMFSILNQHFDQGKQIILAADKGPDELSGYTDRLKTRFESGIIEEIENPNEEDIEKVFKAKINDFGLSPAKWEREAIQYIARNNTSSIRKLEGTIKTVKLYSTFENDIQYTATVMKNIFKDLALDKSELTASRIINKISLYYKINRKELLGSSRKKEIAMARQMVFYTLREMLNMSYKEIGKEMGRDHSTVISGVNKIEKQLKIDNTVKIAFQKLKQKITTHN